MDRLLNLEYRGWWIQVSPLADKGRWVGAVYKEGNASWVTEATRSSFATPKEAYEWAFAEIHKAEKT